MQDRKIIMILCLAHGRQFKLLLDYSYLKNNFNLDVRGVLHVGAHFGQEYETYKANNIKNMVFFEPLTKNFKVLEDNVSQTDNVRLINCALGERRETAMMFVESANQGQSSSILEPDIHLKQYPHIKFEDQEEVEVYTLDSFLDSGEIDDKDFNMINMDVQGYELVVLRGAKKFLHSIDYIITEINRASVYRNCAMVNEIDEFLKVYGFKRVATSWEGVTWGDALYIKDQGG